jgi:FkbH-like protein
MVLKKEYFSSMRINWQDKAKNMEEIAEELNIGTDSMVFFDDSVYERELVRSLLPEVTVVEVPADAGRYPDTIRNLVEFEQLRLTGEDLGRNGMYAGNRRRNEARRKFGSAEEFIKSLDIKVILEASNDFTIPRIAQLTQKTNQFNLTTRRYTQEDITALHHSENHLVLSARVTDIYGDNGITGVCIATLEGDEAYIDTFLLSCRVMGRNVEYAFLSKVVDLLRSRGVKTIRARYVRTQRNEATMNFYQNAGFSAVSSDEDGTAYRLDASRSVRRVDIETVMKGDNEYER